jgi:mono/diheme cytochrome c family protein
MLKAATICLAICAALAAQEIQKVPIQPTSAADGKEMFTTYCAVCHGTSGKGDGPAAAALKKRPADLTQLARKNNGTLQPGDQSHEWRSDFSPFAGPASFSRVGGRDYPFRNITTVTIVTRKT